MTGGGAVEAGGVIVGVQPHAQPDRRPQGIATDRHDAHPLLVLHAGGRKAVVPARQG
jgi:hypothetical protein